MSPLASVFATLPESQQTEIVQSWFANELFRIANGPSKAREGELAMLIDHKLFAALPEDAQQKMKRLCERCRDL